MTFLMRVVYAEVSQNRSPYMAHDTDLDMLILPIPERPCEVWPEKTR
jgi:hypothetical protein